MSTILALDQSTRCSGYAIFNNDQLINSGTFTLIDDDLGIRLVKFREKIISLIKDNNIDEVVFEDIQLQSNSGKNMGVTVYKALAEVFGVLTELLTELGIQYEVIPAVTWKSLLNIKGKARPEQKKNAQSFVATTYAKKVSQDESDAICIGTAYIKQKNSAYSWD